MLDTTVQKEQEQEIEFPECGIYAIINIFSEKFYIGSAVNLKLRWRLHKNELIRNVHPNIHLQRSWNKYWINPFIFVVIEYVENKNKLLEKEQYWMDELKPKYNICLKAGSRLGLKHSEEAKIKLRNVKYTEERIKKVSLALTGRKQTVQHIKNMIEGKKGYKHSKETKAKIGQANSLSLKGKKHSEETKRKMSIARQNYFKERSMQWI